MSGHDDPRLARLRRELYRPGATEADRERYLALRDELTRDRPPAVALVGIEEPAPRAAEPARRRALGTGGLLLGGAVVAVAALSLTAPGAAAPDRPAPVVRAATVEVAVGDSEILGQRFTGSGDRVVPLITGGAPLDGGRLVVELSSTDPTRITWRAEGGAGHPASRVVAGGTAEPRRDAPVRGTAQYEGAPPARLVVRAPEGTEWSMTVAFTR